MSRLHGNIQGLTDKVIAAELVTDAVAGATVLYVDDIGPIYKAQSLLIAGLVYPYVDVDEDANTVTIGTPLAANVYADDETTSSQIAVWDANLGQVASEQSALVAINDLDDGDPIRATLSHGLADKLGRMPRVQLGESVTIERDTGQWSITELHGKTVSTDGRFAYNPLARAYLPSALSIPNNTWTTIIGMGVYSSDDITYDAGTGLFSINTSATYLIIAGVTFDDDAATPDVGSRAIRLRFETFIGTGNSRMVKYPASATTGIETVQEKDFFAGERVAAEAWQNSGAALDILGASGMTANCTFNIRRVN